VVVGFWVQLDTETILLRALATMLVCWFVGRLVGAIAQRVVNEHIEQVKAANPIPEDAPYLENGEHAPVGADAAEERQGRTDEVVNSSEAA
jgi:hypothetical protein